MVSLANSFLACDRMDGGVCHPFLQARLITPVCTVPYFHAQLIKRFEMTKAIAKLVFERRPRPANVLIVKG